MTKQVTVDVSKVTYDVGQKLVDLVAQLKKAAADGIQLSDLTVVVQAVIADLLPAMQEMNEIPVEMKADLVPFERAVALMAGDLLKVVLG